MTIDAKTRLVTLLGFPVEHSMSPALHNPAFEAQGVNAAYVATPVRREDLATAVNGLRAMHFLGANVTIPHKQAVLPLLDVVTETAEAVGAVNTIVCQGTDDEILRLKGDNTDVAGFVMPLADHATTLRDGSATILGAGGAARAVVYGLLTRFDLHRLTIAARRPEQAEALAREFSPWADGTAVTATALAEAPVRASRLVVNATPVGMHPNEDETPWQTVSDFSDGQIVYDLVYNPRETRLLREASERNATVIGGLDMLIGQAADAFRQWTGREMPISLVRSAL
ncbi:shikimate dehydrogenase [Longibacter salinarum]|uniref:Shikimate dehydrogenase (NADP(+)) n=1 Tax=Longibacter salinarum TaxID=1850348 RepID=A0A2A8CWF0_9BACT|nr:shikimate dehydrogenase [Longibacter salinarum]PEN13025.1 shikimate dehydrogenase [Longibacter salinarum]